MVSFVCVRAPSGQHHKEAVHAPVETERISLTVNFKSDKEAERYRADRESSTSSGDDGDPSHLFDRPSELWSKMQEELKRVYHLKDHQHSCFTFKVDAEIGLRKEGGRRTVVLNKTQFLHLIKRVQSPPILYMHACTYM